MMLATSSAPRVGLGFAASARVLLVESRPAALAAVARGLAAQGMACASVLGYAQAIDKLRFDPRFSLCISDVAGDDAGRRELQYRFPEIAWLVQAGLDAGPALRPQDALVSGSPDDTLSAALSTLRSHPYDQAILDAMDASLGAMWTPFGPRAGAHFMRRDARVLDGIAALVEVSGQHLWGRVSFSADEKVLYRHARRLLGTEPRSVDDVADIAGECSNRLASELRRHYRGLGFTSTQGAPMVVAGTGTRVAPLCQTPSLVVEHRSERGDRVCFEWHMGARLPAGGPTAYGHLPTGEVVFM